MLGTRLGIGETEAAAMLQRWHGFARGLDFGRINPGQDNAGLDAPFGVPGANVGRGAGAPSTSAAPCAAHASAAGLSSGAATS